MIDDFLNHLIIIYFYFGLDALSQDMNNGHNLISELRPRKQVV